MTLKPVFVKSLYVSLGGTAVLGIAALLFGRFGEIELRTLLTTLLVGLWSVLCLGCLTTLGSAYDRVGRLGLAVSTAALSLGVAVTWLTRGVDMDASTLEDQLLRAFLASGVVAFAVTHAALLYKVGAEGPASVRPMQTTALVALTAVAGMLVALVYFPDIHGGYWRLLGVCAILDAVGTVFTVLAAKFGRERIAA